MFHWGTWNIIPDSVFAEGTVRSFSAVARFKGAMFNLGTGIGSSLHNGEFKVDPDALK